MRWSVIPVLGLAVAGVAGGIAVIPGDQEVALMRLRDGRIDAARQEYDRMIEEGATGAAVFGALISAQLAQGRRDEAIDTVRRFIADNPSDMAARRLLAQMLHAAMKYEEYVGQMTFILDAAPTRDLYLELSDFHAGLGETSEEYELLERAAVHYQLDTDRLSRLAELHAAYGEPGQALDILLRLDREGAGGLSAQERVLLLALATDANTTNVDPVTLASRWLSAPGAGGSLHRYATVIADRGRRQAALTLIETTQPPDRDTLNLAILRIDLLRAAGRLDDALDVIAGWQARPQPLPAPLASRLLAIALDRGETGQALALFSELEPGDVDIDTLSVLLDTVASGGDIEQAGLLLAGLRNDTLAPVPLQAARLAAVARDTERLRYWLQRIPESTSASERVVIARLQIDAGNPNEARRILSGIADDLAARSEVEDVFALVTLYRDLSMVGQGFELFTRLRQENPEDRRIAGAWILLATLSGNVGAAKAAFDGIRGFETAELESILYAAVEMNAPALRLAAAERLHERLQTPASSRQYAEALVAVGQREAALPMLEALSRRSTEDFWNYVAVLEALGMTDAYRDAFAQALARDVFEGQDLTNAVFALIESGGAAQALPYVRRFAEERGGEWIDIYVRTAGLAGEGGEATDFLAARVERLAAEGGDIPESYVFSLIEQSAQRAAAVLGPMADRQPARWADTYLEALRRAGDGRKAVAWLDSTLARNDLARDTRERLYYALESLAPRRPILLSHARRLAETAGGDWIDTYTSLLRDLGREKEAMDWLVAQADAGRIGPERLQAVAEQRLAAGDKAGAVADYRRLARNAGPQSEIVQRLLYLWGPRPGSEATEWLLERAQRAPAGERADWLEFASEKGGAERVLSILETIPADERANEEQQLYVELLVRQGKVAGLPSALDDLLLRPIGTEALVALAEQLQAAELSAQSERVWTRVLAEDPGEARAVRAKGLLAYARRQYEVTIDLLTRYRQIAPKTTDIEATYFLAEALSARKRRDEAVPLYQEVVSSAGSVADRSAYERGLIATSLYRTGQREQGLSSYRELLQEYPANDTIRADYATLLIEDGQLERASDVVNRR